MAQARDVTQLVVTCARIWWLKGQATPWAVMLDDVRFWRARSYVAMGEVTSRSLARGDRPFPLPAGIDIPPAGWVEVSGSLSLVLDDGRELV